MKKISLILNGSKVTDFYEDGINSLDLLKNVGHRDAIAESCSPLGKCGKCTILINGHPTLACLTRPEEVADKYIQTLGKETLPCLILFNSFQLGRRFLMSKNPSSIGRGMAADIVIKDNSISRKHVLIEKNTKGFYIEDQNSTNGTYVNFKEVKGKVPLKTGDMIRIGNLLFKFYEHDNLESAIHDRMYRLANFDQLTKVYNRKYVLDTLKREVHDAIEKNQKLSLIFVDLDHFKKVNDVHGHQAGDAVLKSTGKILKQAIREYDTIGRYGGEEFVIVLPETDRHDAIKVAERIRKTIEEHQYELVFYDDNQIKKTIKHKQTASFGVSWICPERNNMRSLLEESDQNLYQSKHNGRNQVTASKLT